MDSELIEKAADAVDAAWQKRAQEGRHDSLAECAARAAFAVFEAAQKPTDDEREALAKALNRDARRIRESRDRAGIEFGSMTVPIDAMLKLTESAPSLEPLTEPSGCPQCHRTDGQHKLGCGERFGAEPQTEPTTVQMPKRRLRACVEQWPECETGDYDPACCRFPKSRSATVYDADRVAESDLEPPTEPTVMQYVGRRGGKTQALIESMLEQANDQGIRVEVVYPQAEPTDALIRQAVMDGLAEAAVLQSPFQPQMRELVVEQITLALRAALNTKEEDR